MDSLDAVEVVMAFEDEFGTYVHTILISSILIFTPMHTHTHIHTL